MFGLGKKKEAESPVAPGIPTDQVIALKQRGMNNDQIIPELERQGFNSSQIFEALNQANTNGAGLEQAPGMQPQVDFSQQPIPQPEAPPQEPEINKEQIEEVAEAIIDEKWKEFEEDLKVIIDWKEKTEIKINQFDQKITDLTTTLSSLHKSLLGKISQYDKNIIDVGTEIKAMEKVFQKILPNLTENVNKLDRMTKNSKTIKK